MVLQPHKRHALLVPDHLHGVHHIGVLRPEDMAHPGARDHLDTTAAAPSAQGHFDVLSTPLSHVRVVGAHPLPIIAPHRKDASRQGRRGIRVWVYVRLVPLLDEVHPVERQRPIEPADVVVRCPVRLEVLLWDDVYNRHDHDIMGLRRLGKALEQRLQPLLADDAMRLVEEHHRAAHQTGTDDLGPDETLPLLVPVHMDLWVQRSQLVVILPLLGVPIIHKQDLVDELHRRVRQKRPHRGAHLLPSLVQVGDDDGGGGQ
mmetsp:Transcript_48470/g.139390  ORF Transcript_48470/g.139390 Transcript_48470/m.139390 type:complete len:259 (-) Transcript_48470:414-1190(-)